MIIIDKGVNIKKKEVFIEEKVVIIMKKGMIINLFLLHSFFRGKAKI